MPESMPVMPGQVCRKISHFATGMEGLLTWTFRSGYTAFDGLSTGLNQYSRVKLLFGKTVAVKIKRRSG